MAAGIASDRLPYFFFVRAQPTFDWMAVSEASLNAVGGIRWPLPWNLLRHRLATRLRTEGVDAEIIDSFLGHGEAGSESHSHISPRVWRDDRTSSALALARSFEALGFAAPADAGELAPISLDLARDYRVFAEDVRFGIDARRTRREEAHMRARRAADAEITDALAGRTFDALSTDELERLGWQMLLSSSGMPRTNASLRYEVLERRIEASWRETGRKPPRRRRMVPTGPPESIFTPQAVGAIRWLREARQLLPTDRAVDSDREGANRLALLAAVDICVRSRVSDERLLQDVAARRDVRLVICARRFWLEHCDGREEFPDQPRRRTPISPQAARWLGRALQARRGGTGITKLPQSLAALAARFGPADLMGEPLQLLTRMAPVVEQANALDLPGIVTGYLHGRTTSWGLPPLDWIRALTARAARAPVDTEAAGLTDESMADEAEGAPAAALQDVISVRPPRRQARPFDERLPLTRQFLADINTLLRDYGSLSAVTNTETKGRRETRAALRQLERDADPSVSRSVRYLALWTERLLVQRGKRFLAVSTVQRYLAALAGRFRDFAHDIDIAELDGDELTDLYASMLSETSVEADGQVDAIDARYILERLRDFQRFAESTLGLAAPDWSEIVADGPAAHGAPGLVLEAEYLHALRRLCPEVATATRRQLCDAMVLLLTFRFGLREKEAWGLQRADWADHFETLVVLVRVNRLRGLKWRPSSTRQVPLLCELSRHERSVVERVLASWDVLSGGDQRVPLFAEGKDGRMFSLRAMSTRLIDALRRATLNQDTVLHHARHSFACELFLALALDARSLNRLVSSPRWIDSKYARRLLLGGTESTRRALWALARALGHAHPRTSLKSYVHFVPEWVAAQLPELGRVSEARDVEGADDLDGWTDDPRYLLPVAVPPVTTLRRAQMRDLVTALQLLGRGLTSDAIGSALGIDHVQVERLEDVVEQITLRMTRKRRPPSTAKKSQLKRARTSMEAAHQKYGMRSDPNVLHHIEQHRWAALLTIASAKALEKREESWGAAIAVEMVGKTRQLLMWRESHFAMLKQFVDDLQLERHIRVFETEDLDPVVAQWAQSAGFGQRKSQRNAGGTKGFQIDGVREGHPARVVVHRCAVTRSSDSECLETAYELLTLWIAYAVLRSASPDAAAGAPG